MNQHRFQAARDPRAENVPMPRPALLWAFGLQIRMDRMGERAAPRRERLPGFRASPPSNCCWAPGAQPETRSSRNPVIQKQRQDPMRRETIAERTAGPCATATRAAAGTGRPMKALTSLLRAAYPPPDKNRGNTLYAVSAASLMAVCLTVAEATHGIGAPSKAARPSPGAARGRKTVPFCAALPHAT